MTHSLQKAVNVGSAVHVMTGDDDGSESGLNLTSSQPGIGSFGGVCRTAVIPIVACILAENYQHVSSAIASHLKCRGIVYMRYRESRLLYSRQKAENAPCRVADGVLGSLRHMVDILLAKGAVHTKESQSVCHGHHLL